MKSYTHSYAGGEITPEMIGRIDLNKRQTGLSQCLNFIVLPHGPITRRGGTVFVNDSISDAAAGWLVPFAYSVSDTVAVELGNGTMRFHTQGASLAVGSPAAYNGATAYTPGDLVTSSGTKYVCVANTTGNAPPNTTYWHAQPATGEYQLPTPYATADLPDIHFKQSGDVLTLMHPSYATRELRRYAATKWALSTVSFAPTLSAPTSPSATATVGTGTTTHSYVVTAVADNGVDESLASSVASCTNNLNTAGNYNTVTWTAVSGAARYNVYKKTGGVYGYIGQASSNSFIDDNFSGDQARTPPEEIFDLNTGAGEYPSTGTYHDQRRWFAGTDNDPQVLKGTRPDTETNLTSSIPSQDDDAINVRVNAQQQNRVLHLVSMGDLIALTASAEWLIYPASGEVITPSTITRRPQAFAGSSNVQPVVTPSSVLYVQARGVRVRELTYNDKQSGSVLNSVDVSLMAPHLFTGYTIKQMAHAATPDPITWVLRSDGVLLGMTYVPEQQVYAWHHHTVDGVVESICVVAEGSEDVMYLLVRRTIDGNTVRYVEYLHSRLFTALEDCFFVDCGLTYSGAATATVSGLDHLEGKEVAILANGAVHPRRTVTSGSVTLNAATYTKVQVGLPIISDAVTLPLALEAMQAAGQGTQKNVSEVSLRVRDTSGISAGPDFDNLTEYPARAVSDDVGAPPALKTKEVSMEITGDWNADGAIYIRKDDPLPMTLCAHTLKVATGG